jgi:hypothetical protein
VSATTDMLELGAMSTEIRGAQRSVRMALRSRTLTPQQLFTEPPECLLHRPVFQVLGMVPRFGKFSLIALNDSAMRQGWNIALPLGGTPPAMRDWIIEWLNAREAWWNVT